MDAGVAIIGGADGPTKIWITLDWPIAVVMGVSGAVLIGAAVFLIHSIRKRRKTE